ncbi:MAG: DCC1-like thiol-disulfide oxidoreductase family protein [Armatimonadota bacterium]|nr:DCC1-like thiol-disulfide oxidoreductase family protein [Armatimonadota bacterium]
MLRPFTRAASNVQRSVQPDGVRTAIPTPLILYDGVCRLCTGTVRFVIKRDRRKRFRFASMQSALGQQLLRRFGLPPDELTTFVLVEADGHFTRSTAALRVARHLDGLWPALYALIVIPRPLRDRVYDWVARHRYQWFGRLETCLVPTPDVRDRFVDAG